MGQDTTARRFVVNTRRSVLFAVIATLALSACAGAVAPSVLFSSGPEASVGRDSAVVIIDNAFQNGTLTVSVGSTISWTNRGRKDHTVSTSGGTFGSNGPLAGGASYQHRFDAVGAFAYFCAIHSSMKGTITVTP